MSSADSVKLGEINTIDKSFLQVYKTDIAPKIADIDVFIRSIGEESITPSDVSELLYITEDEVMDIMHEENMVTLNSYTFFSIMKKGSSSICKMFTRELSRGMSSFYSVEDISFIYGIDIEYVKQASLILGVNVFTQGLLPVVFSLIPVETNDSIES